MKKQPIISLLCCFLLFVAGCSTPHQGNTYDIIAFGAKGDGKTDDAAAIQRAINACSAAGGGTVIIPAGHTFLCGPLQLASYVNLHLEPNSRLLANPDESIYTESAFRENRGERNDVDQWKRLKTNIHYRYRRNRRKRNRLHGQRTG